MRLILYFLIFFSTLCFAQDRTGEYLYNELITADGVVNQHTFIFNYNSDLDQQVDEALENSGIDHFAIFEKEKIQERVPNSQDDVDKLVEKANKANIAVVRNQLKIVDSPTKQEVKLGITLTAYRGVTSSVIWLTTPGVDPLMAAAAVSIASSTTFIHATFSRTLNKLYAKKYFSQTAGDVSDRVNLVRRTLYGAILGEVMKFSAQGMTAMLSSPKPHIDIATNLLSVGLGQNLLNSSVYKNIQKTHPHIVTKFNFYVSMMMSPISMLDLASGDHIPVLLSLGYLQVKVTSVGLFGIYFGLKKMVDKKPEAVIKAIEKIDFALMTFKEKVISTWVGTQKSLRSLCSRPLKI